ncbi:MAG: T9SS type A sorting domain-containing protein [Bacteroidia bacterium]
MRKLLITLMIGLLVFSNGLLMGQRTNQLIDKAFPRDTVVPSGIVGWALDTAINTFDNSKWHQKWDEANVFKAELKHQDYALRIGKGGQLYSIETPIGEICPPQWREHAWVDDTWLLTTYQYDIKPVPGSSNNGNEFTPFIHQCGVYPHIDADFQQKTQFWAPVVAEEWDAQENAFSTISLGMISSGPSYNRADMLMYQKTRDLGDGVFEVVYMAYNYNTSYPDSLAQENYTTDFGPWGGVRESLLPDHILSNEDSTWSLANNGNFPNYQNSKKSGGWAINTQDANDSTSYSLGYVFGREKPQGARSKSYSYGTTGPQRSFTVQAITYRQTFRPGNIFHCRLYFVLGELEDVVTKCAQLEPFVTASFLEFPQSNATKIPLYVEEQDGQRVIATTGDVPAFYVYAEPVQNSKPLYLVRNNVDKVWHATSDPYMTMSRYPIPNSNPPETGIRPYDGTTEIVKLFGFVMPQAFADTSMDYVALNSVLTDTSYYPERGLYDVDIMVLKGDDSVSTSLPKFDPAFVHIFPNPSTGIINISLERKTGGYAEIEVRDIMGRLVKKQSHTLKDSKTISLDLGKLKAGVYYVQVSTEAGSYTEKILFQ